MEIEITPEPTPAEREAIEKALAALAAEEARPLRSAWWRRGLDEAVAEDPDGTEGLTGDRADGRG